MKSIVKVNISAEKLYSKALKLERESGQRQSVALLLEQAAKLGSARATYALATWHLFGIYFKKNWKTGNLLLQRSASLGYSQACFDLAVSLEIGKGIKKNLKRAFRFYLEAALRGDNAALKEVARCYWHGIGVGKDRVLADLWGDVWKTGKIKKVKIVNKKPFQGIR